MSKRDAYVQKMKAQLDEWNALIDQIRAKADKADADAKLRYEDQLAEFRQKRDELVQRLKVIETSGEMAWDDIKEGLAGMWDAFTDALGKAKSEFERGYREDSKD